MKTRYDDLLVGAPYEQNQCSKSTSAKLVSTGTLYLFINQKKARIPYSYDKYIRISCPPGLTNHHDSWFGYRIVKLGDINLDGYIGQFPIQLAVLSYYCTCTNQQPVQIGN
ncbi:hypothetical protein Ciccas_011180 [Cichlidogyrus casuarinus]|uniref:Uncharacterized protein n=1 Tax=Cichlidogyrus casuarinus TaxID=1844966 RepID=A0ABD2PSM9_9PLAT